MSEQWFVVNVGDAEWESKGEFGVRCRFESPEARFPAFGITVQVIQPGQPSSLYHAEDAQEGFLVLAGECLAVIEGQEHPLRQWDYFHCPPGPRHVLVGAGDQPCTVLMVGAPRSASLRRSSIPRTPSRRATAPRSPRRRGPPSRPTPTVRTAGPRQPAPRPDA